MFQRLCDMICRMDGLHGDRLPEGPLLPLRPRGSITWQQLTAALALGIILGVGGLYLFRFLVRPLALLVLSVSIAAALAPVVERMGRRIPRALAVVLVYVVLALIVFGIFGLTVPLLIGQGRSLLFNLRRLQPLISGWLSTIGVDAANVGAMLLNELGRLGEYAMRLPVGLVTGLLEMVLILFLSLYWLLMMPHTKGFFLSLFATESKPFVNEVLANLGQSMGGYLRGAAINGMVIAVLEYIGLTIIGVPYALTLGALAGLMEFFPTIGPIISGTIATLVALSISPRIAIITVIYAIVLQQTEGHILVPWIMRSQTNVSPLLAIFAVISGAAVGGLLGAVIAIPIASALTVMVKMVVAPAVRRANGVQEPQEFK